MAVLVINILMIAVLGLHYGSVVGQQCSRSTGTMFASKTAYRNSVLAQASASRPVLQPDCQPIQVYVLARHGTRYPGASDVQDMLIKVPRLQNLIVNASESKLGEICSEDIDIIKNWKMEFNGSATNLLADEGKREMIGIAKRLKERFPSLFDKPYSASRYLFRSTKTSRTEESAKSFAQGLFDTDKGVKFDITDDDQLLRFYKKCTKWEKEVDDNDEALDEYYHFTLLNDAKEMTEAVSRRLGLASILPFDDVWVLYEMCRFDIAWNQATSTSSSFPNRPWCNLFSDTDLDVLEYAEDLRYYWKEGYGYKINYEQACPVLKNLIDNFNRSVLESGAKHASAGDDHQSQLAPPVGLFHFSHSGMLLKVYARLGLYADDTPLLATNYRERMMQRKWRTSLMDPFAGNIAFTLFKCENEEYKVSAYVQEQEVILANCTTFMCPLNTFLETYGPIGETCDLDAICGVSNKSSSVVIAGVTLAVIFVIASMTTITWLT